MGKEPTNKYELMLILSSELGESETEKSLKEIKTILSEHTASVFDEDIWGRHEMAYRIKKEDSGYYAVLYIDIKDRSQLSQIERALNLYQPLLRFLVLKIDKNHFIKTLEEYEVEKAQEKEERAKEKEEKAKKSAAPQRKPRPVKIEEKKEEVKEVKEEKKAELKEDKKAEDEAESESKLKEVDEKLKNLIDDPDIAI